MRFGRILACGVVAVVLAAGFFRLPLPEDVDAWRVAKAVGVTTLIAGMWLTQAAPLGPTSLLPLALFPLLGVLPTAAVAPAYAHPILWLFFGGFALAIAMERWGLHTRAAAAILRRFAARPRRIVLGFMFAALLPSMWISNTATALMLLPIGLAVVQRVERSAGPELARRFGIAVLLCIAYGASIGGMATPIGTAPNGLLMKNHEVLVQMGAPDLGFLQWLLGVAPFSLVFGLVIWWLLVHLLVRIPATGDPVPMDGLPDGPLGIPQKRVLTLFGVAVLLWVTRGDAQLGAFTFQGWSSWLAPAGTDGSRYVQDGSVAIAVAVAAFLIPAGGGDRHSLLHPDDLQKIPWSILFLLGAGIAMAGAMEQSGLTRAVGGWLAPALQATSPEGSTALIAGSITLLTEVTSNTATTSVVLPMLRDTGLAAGIDPRLLMLPATLAASCAFMFPIATPPNAVVFSSGRLRFVDMARAGLVINLVGVALLTGWFLVWIAPLWGIQGGVAPDWMPPR